MRRYIIHLVLFFLTVASTWVTWGPSYSVTIMTILLGHELGHYLMSRKYGVHATLPFFLPLPLISPFGTLGAVIRMKSSVPSRKALFDTGAAGPLTSLVLSIPAIIIGLRLSKTIPVSQLGEGGIRLADPLLFSFIQRLILGEVPGNYEVILHPIGYAGWVGLFVTALNLLPVGQLDGGHIAYALFGKKSKAVYAAFIALTAFFLVFYSFAWFLLLVLMILFGFRHPAPVDDFPLDRKRKWIGVIALLGFVVSFTPNPFLEVPSLLEVIHKGLPFLLGAP